MAIPIELPNWAMVLNTAPARACVSTGKTSMIKMLETVKRTKKSFNGISLDFYLFIFFWRGGGGRGRAQKKIEGVDRPSVERGRISTAQNSAYQ